MTSPQLQLALWVVQPALLAPLAVVMFRRRLHKQFPFFFAFIIFQIVSFAVEFLLYRGASHRAYFCAFWFDTAINLIFQFKIIHEVFVDIFRPYHALKDLGTALFKWAALVMVLVSGVFVSTNPVLGDPIGRNILTVHRCIQVIQCGLVLFLLGFCKPLGVSWRRQSFGIALGFGLFAGSQLVCYALCSGDHIASAISDIASMIAFNTGIVVWFGYSSVKKPELGVPILIPQRWDTALMDIQPRTEADSESLIPMFEHMVDRAFSRTQDRHA